MTTDRERMDAAWVAYLRSDGNDEYPGIAFEAGWNAALAAADTLAPPPALESDITQPWPSPMLLELGEYLYREWVHSDPMPGDKEWRELDDAEREMYCHFVKRIVDKFLALTKRPATGEG